VGDSIARLPLDAITARVMIRPLKPSGVERLKAKIAKIGYKEAFPITVQPHGDGYELIDGNHRLEAARALGLATIPALVLSERLPDLDAKRHARQANEASETVVPTTFVDDAELIWAEADNGRTQEQIGGVLGWSREKVAQYRQLRKIAPEAWAVVVTSFSDIVTDDDETVVTPAVTTVTFTEGLLRSILSLSAAQQLELVQALASGKITKGDFSKRAKLYQGRNEIAAWLKGQLPDLGAEWFDAPTADIARGVYDSDWAGQPGKRLARLVESISDEWQRKVGVQVFCDDFAHVALTLPAGSIDLILTDPPYGISAYSGVTKVGNKLVAANFDGDHDDWDSADPDEFQVQLQAWVNDWARLLRPGGALVAFTDKALISDLWRFCKAAGLQPKNTIVWVKANPHPAALARRNLISATEFMLWAVKPGEGYTFNPSDHWNLQNVIEAPLCAGGERIKNEKGETLHPTQKPLAVLTPLIEAFSNRGDTVLDGFAGVGSTGVAAQALGRKFIGVERDAAFAEAMKRRLA
jgi:DNA modification methylase